jgi:hypothetical protein
MVGFDVLPITKMLLLKRAAALTYTEGIELH